MTQMTQMTQNSLNGRSILLIIGGGIAAYKTPELIRQFKAAGADVRCILTQSGAQFVTPLTLSSVSGDKVYDTLFDLMSEAEMGHIQLSRDADLIIVAPATADMMGKMAHGLANDLASTTLLATNKPVLIAPAMNVQMWLHEATQSNLSVLAGRGIQFVGPNEGDMACGETGMGRMSEPDEILHAAQTALNPNAALLAGKKVLVTAGTTYEPIDPIRFIANRSSGKQGYAIAAALADMGADTVLVSGPCALVPPRNVRLEKVETAQEMLAAVETQLPRDIAVMTAAVGDWRSAGQTNSKIKKQENGKVAPLELVENPDILAHLATHKNRPDLLIGFAAETDNVLDYARAKLKRKGCDWIVANDVSITHGGGGTHGTHGVMGGDENTVHILNQHGTQSWKKMSKHQVAAQLAEKIAEHCGAM